MRLERMSWKDCEEYFKDHDMVILTTGSTENHGIHNPLGTDTMIPNKILELIEKQSDVLICQPYLMGMPIFIQNTRVQFQLVVIY